VTSSVKLVCDYEVTRLTNNNFRRERIYTLVEIGSRANSKASVESLKPMWLQIILFQCLIEVRRAREFSSVARFAPALRAKWIGRRYSTPADIGLAALLHQFGRL
jgi:hypothetical protein